jgi:glycyl-tRNA synthetase beta chain
VAGRLAKADLTSEMVREFTELQGTMGGIYAREEGLPEPVWKAIYYHYLPVGLEANLPPTREQLGAGAIPWATVSLADKTDSVVGMFLAGERPTGTRDPFGVRRQLQGILKILVDLPELTGLRVPLDVEGLVRRAAGSFERIDAGDFVTDLRTFAVDRLRHIFTQRGFRADEIEAALGATGAGLAPLVVRWRLEALQGVRGSEDFAALAVLFKRVKNIAREISAAPQESYREPLDRSVLTLPAEQALLSEFDARSPGIREAVARHDFRRAMAEAATLRAVVDRFFTDVFVMVDDSRLRTARLMAMVAVRDLVMKIADISQLAPAGA